MTEARERGGGGVVVVVRKRAREREIERERERLIEAYVLSCFITMCLGNSTMKFISLFACFKSTRFTSSYTPATPSPHRYTLAKDYINTDLF